MLCIVGRAGAVGAFGGRNSSGDGVVVLGPPEFEPEGYKPDLDMMDELAAVNLLTVSIRAPQKEVTQKDVHATERSMPLN
ncbi:MAG: hypothetical protein ACUVQR_06320 [Thermogutta sp.]